jgi:hypothetical protein
LSVARFHYGHQFVVAGEAGIVRFQPRCLLYEQARTRSANAVEVRTGVEVQFVRWGGPQILAGTVRRIEPSGFTKLTALGLEGQLVNVLVEPPLPDSRWYGIGDGYQMDTSLTVYQHDHAFALPMNGSCNACQHTMHGHSEAASVHP